MILERFSIDENGTIFRVEFYKEDKFTGMILINFGEEKILKNNKSYITETKKLNLVISKL